MGAFRNPWVIVLLVLLVVLLFGAGKLPGLARNVGKSMRIFKSEVEELRGDVADTAEDEDDEPARRSSRDGDRRREARPEREYDPRDEDRRDDREPVRASEDEDSYRRD